MLTREQFQVVYEQGPEALYVLFAKMHSTVETLEARVKELEDLLGKGNPATIRVSRLLLTDPERNPVLNHCEARVVVVPAASQGTQDTHLSSLRIPITSCLCVRVNASTAKHP